MHEVRAYRAVARLFAAALLAVVTGWLGAAPALSQGTQPGANPVQIGSTSGDTPQPWTVNCTSDPQSGELVCSMTQVLIASDTRQRLVGATVFRPSPSATAVMRFSLPHGILLQKGVNVAIDDKAPTNVPIIIADQNGSYAELELSQNVIVSLQAGGTLHVGVTAGSGDPVDFSLSLKGFTAAFAKL